MNHKSLHDAAVERITALVTAHFRDRPEYTVLSQMHWCPLRDFPNRCYLFDVAVVEGSVLADAGSDGAVFGPDLHPITVIDVVGRKDFEEEFYDKPDDLLLTSVLDYCLFDPSAIFLRPQLYAARKRNGGDWILRASTDGVFFSSTGFRLDIDGPDVQLRPSGTARVEEDLHRCRKLLARTSNEQAADGLRRKVYWIEEKLAADPRLAGNG